MCILVVAVERHPLFSVVACHNREEDLSRRTSALLRGEGEEVVCARDLEAGGTWMGLSRTNGTLVALTNVRQRGASASSEAPEVAGPLTSRGVLVDELLRLDRAQLVGRCDAAGWLDLSPRRYAGFNLMHCSLLDDRPRVLFASNRDQHYLGAAEPARGDAGSGSGPTSGSRSRVWMLEPGVHCVSNSMLNDATWPKVTHVREAVSRELSETRGGHGEGLTAKHEADEAGRLARRLLGVMSRTGPLAEPGSQALEAVLGQSPCSPEVEASLQAVFVAHDRGRPIPPLTRDGTRAQTVCLRGRFAVYYYFRSTDTYPDLPAEPECVVVPLEPLRARRVRAGSAGGVVASWLAVGLSAAVAAASLLARTYLLHSN